MGAKGVTTLQILAHTALSEQYSSPIAEMAIEQTDWQTQTDRQTDMEIIQAADVMFSFYVNLYINCTIKYILLTHHLDKIGTDTNRQTDRQTDRQTWRSYRLLM